MTEMEFRDYDGMMPEMDDDALVIDDFSHHETEQLLEIYKPDIFCAGIKEKFGVQKMGIPCKQLHSYDYGGPYAGFVGAINFYNDIDRMVNMKIWSYRDSALAAGGQAAGGSGRRLDRASQRHQPVRRHCSPSRKGMLYAFTPHYRRGYWNAPHSR